MGTPVALVSKGFNVGADTDWEIRMILGQLSCSHASPWSRNRFQQDKKKFNSFENLARPKCCKTDLLLGSTRIFFSWHSVIVARTQISTRKKLHRTPSWRCHDWRKAVCQGPFLAMPQ